MIKIEFKEAYKRIVKNGFGPYFAKMLIFDRPDNITRLFVIFESDQICSVTFGYPSELVPSRQEVLQQLGISKEQDEEMQLKYKNNAI